MDFWGSVKNRKEGFQKPSREPRRNVWNRSAVEAQFQAKGRVTGQRRGG